MMSDTLPMDSNSIHQATGPFQPYDPAYDPLKHDTPGRGRAYAPTYWTDSAGVPPEDDGPVTQDMDADVAIIGAGFTGLATAIFLAQEYGIKAIVLEANLVSWGCSSRNGGQALCSFGRLKRSQWIQRYGLDVALKMHFECLEGMRNFKNLIQDIDCDAQLGGHLFIAHRDKLMPALEKEARLLRNTFDYDAHTLKGEEVRHDWLDDQEAVGAMYEPEGIGIHPAKLAFGYLKKARRLGVKVHPASPVESWKTEKGIHYLKTPGGVVKAKSVGVATGGYTSQSLHPELKNRLMPIISNSIVTRPLTDSEVDSINGRTRSIITDSRVLRHYYRLLPGNRLQIGSRGAVTGKQANKKKFEDKLKDSMWRKFPSLKSVDIDYSWWGWVDVSHDMMPRICQPDLSKSIYYAVGYGGSGVMYSAQAGRRMAQRIAGVGQMPELPIFNTKLPYPNVNDMVESRFFSPFRRLGQRAMYQWYYAKDEFF